jgi:hypothetical protein
MTSRASRPGGGCHRLDGSDGRDCRSVEVDSDLVAALRQNDPAALAAGVVGRRRNVSVADLLKCAMHDRKGQIWAR